MKKVYLAIIIIIVILSLIAFFYPRSLGRLTCTMGQIDQYNCQYKWIEDNCFGLKQLKSPDQNCMDCISELICYGIVYGPSKCYDYIDEPRTEISCG